MSALMHTARLCSPPAFFAGAASRYFDALILAPMALYGAMPWARAAARLCGKVWCYFACLIYARHTRLFVLRYFMRLFFCSYVIYSSFSGKEELASTPRAARSARLRCPGKRVLFRLI